jgi:hypothetical protein
MCRYLGVQLPRSLCPTSWAIRSGLALSKNSFQDPMTRPRVQLHKLTTNGMTLARRR